MTDNENIVEEMNITDENTVDTAENASIEQKQTDDRNAVCKCPKCGGTIKRGKNGFYCSNYKEGCKVGAYKFVASTPIEDEEMKALLNGETIDKKITNKDGSKSWVQKMCYDFDTYKIEFIRKERTISSKKCPICGEDMYENEQGIFCTNKDNCGFVFWKNMNTHSFTDEETDVLFNGEELGPITMKTKTGKSYTTNLKLNKETLKLDFIF